jgi:cell division protein FtsB
MMSGEIMDEQTVTVREKETPREKNISLILILVFFIAATPIGFKLYSSYLDKRLSYLERVAEKNRLQMEMVKIEKENRQLREKKDFLKSREGVEQMARDKLGFAKPGEIPFIVMPQSGSEEHPPLPAKEKPGDKADREKKGKKEVNHQKF